MSKKAISVWKHFHIEVTQGFILTVNMIRLSEDARSVETNFLVVSQGFIFRVSMSR